LTLPFDPVPKTLLDAEGHPHLGVFDQALEAVGLGRRKQRLRPRAWTQFRLKTWEHYWIVTPDLAISLAAVNLRYLKVAWLQVVERSTGKRWEREVRGPRVAMKLADALIDERSTCRHPQLQFDVAHRIGAGEHRLTFHAPARGDAPALSGELLLLDDPRVTRPCVASLPLGPEASMVAHKVPLPISGHIAIAGKTHNVSAADSVAVLDIHQGHYPHETRWQWATFAFHHPQRGLVGLNLTRNGVHDPVTYNENALWVDGQVERLAPAWFEFDSKDLYKPWRMGTEDGRVDLAFNPLAGRKDRTRLPLIAAVYDQPYGTFSGNLATGSWPLEVDGVLGICEDHFARW
jgi:hypothetical protein